MTTFLRDQSGATAGPCRWRMPLVLGTVILILNVASVGAHAQVSWSDADAATGGVKPEALVPAAMGTRTDKAGNSWNFEQNGTLGRVGNSLISSGVNLLINNQQFYSYQPMMTADGSEYVLYDRPNSRAMGIRAVRRIQLMEKEGVVRYVEILSNTTSNPLTVNVSLRTNFGSNFKHYLTDQGAANVVTLGARETGVIVIPGNTQSNRAYVFTLCSERSGTKPTVSSQNRYALTFNYNLSLTPGQTVTLIHAVRQVTVPQSMDRRTLSRLFQPAMVSRLAKGVAPELRKLVANLHNPGAGGAASLLAGSSVEGLGVDRGQRDVLALGESTRLLGTASCGELRLETAYGAATIPFEEVTALVGGNRGRRDSARIFLRDGQVFSGTVTAQNLRFVMASGGKMNLDMESLDRLVRARRDNEGEWPPETSALVETYAGDRLAIQGAETVRLRAVTSWGPLEFGLDEIYWLSPQDDEPVGHYIEFKDGTRCYGFLAGSEVQIESSTFGTHVVDVHQLRSLITRPGDQKARERASSEYSEPVITQPYVALAGNQRVVGRIEIAALNVLTNAESIPVAPDEIRVMTNITEDREDRFRDGPLYRIELWGGGTMTGTLAESTLPITVKGQSWQVPITDIEQLVTPVPQLTEGARQGIAQLIRQLGSDDWQTREKATEELGGYGYVAKTVLEEELRINPDPEVRRRLERVLLRLE